MTILGKQIDYYKVNDKQYMFVEIQPLEVCVQYEKEEIMTTKWTNYFIWKEIETIILEIIEDNMKFCTLPLQFQMKSAYNIEIGYIFKPLKEGYFSFFNPRNSSKKEVTISSGPAGCDNIGSEMYPYSLHVSVYPLKFKTCKLVLKSIFSSENEKHKIREGLKEVLDGGTRRSSYFEVDGNPSILDFDLQKPQRSSRITRAMQLQNGKNDDLHFAASNQGTEHRTCSKLKNSSTKFSKRKYSGDFSQFISKKESKIKSNSPVGNSQTMHTSDQNSLLDYPTVEPEHRILSQQNDKQALHSIGKARKRTGVNEKKTKVSSSHEDKCKSTKNILERNKQKCSSNIRKKRKRVTDCESGSLRNYFNSSSKNCPRSYSKDCVKSNCIFSSDSLDSLPDLSIDTLLLDKLSKESKLKCEREESSKKSDQLKDLSHDSLCKTTATTKSQLADKDEDFEMHLDMSKDSLPYILVERSFDNTQDFEFEKESTVRSMQENRYSRYTSFSDEEIAKSEDCEDKCTNKTIVRSSASSGSILKGYTNSVEGSESKDCKSLMTRIDNLLAFDFDSEENSWNKTNKDSDACSALLNSTHDFTVDIDDLPCLEPQVQEDSSHVEQSDSNISKGKERNIPCITKSKEDCKPYKNSFGEPLTSLSSQTKCNIEETSISNNKTYVEWGTNRKSPIPIRFGNHNQLNVPKTSEDSFDFIEASPVARSSKGVLKSLCNSLQKNNKENKKINKMYPLKNYFNVVPKPVDEKSKKNNEKMSKKSNMKVDSTISSENYCWKKPKHRSGSSKDIKDEGPLPCSSNSDIKLNYESKLDGNSESNAPSDDVTSSQISLDQSLVFYWEEDSVKDAKDPVEEKFLNDVVETINRLTIKDFEFYIEENLEYIKQIILGRVEIESDEILVRAPKKRICNETYLAVVDEDLLVELSDMLNSRFKDIIKSSGRDLPIFYGLVVIVPELLKIIVSSLPVVKERGISTNEEFDELFFSLSSKALQNSSF